MFEESPQPTTVSRRVYVGEDDHLIEVEAKAKRLMRLGVNYKAKLAYTKTADVQPEPSGSFRSQFFCKRQILYALYVFVRPKVLCLV